MATQNPLRVYSSTITSKFQFTLPAKLARFLGWPPGSKLAFDVPDPDSGGFVVRRVNLARARQELPRAVTQLQERVADPAIDPQDLLEQAHALIVAIRRFEEEVLVASTALVTGHSAEEDHS